MLSVPKIDVKAEPESTIIDGGHSMLLNVDPMQKSNRHGKQIFSASIVKGENVVPNIVQDTIGLDQTDVKKVVGQFKNEAELNIFNEHENIPVILYDKHVVLSDSIKRETSTDCILGPTTTSSLPTAATLQASVFSQNHVTNDIGSFECYLCRRKFVNKEALMQHIEFYGLRNERSFQCYNCQQTFHDDRDCRRHMFLFSLLPFVCRICCNIFQSRSELQHHLTFHIDKQLCSNRPNQITSTVTNKFPVVKLVDCLKINGKSTTSKSKEPIAQRIGGDIERQFECYICKEIFFYLESMLAHLIESHPFEVENRMCKRTDKIEERYVCTYPQCHRKYSLKASLAAHTITHKDGKRFAYTYPDCNGTFFTAKALYMHRRIHSDEKKFVCTYDQCGKRFKLPSYLKGQFITIYP